MSKCKILIFLFSLIFITVFGSGRYQSVLADESPSVYQFTPVQEESLYASASGSNGCPEIGVDTALYQYELAVTGQLLADLKATLDVGEQPMLALRTVSTFIASGEGQATARAQVELAVEHNSGERTTLKGIDMDTGAVIWARRLSSISQLEVGDILLVDVQAQGTANSGGCHSEDHALVSWEMASVVLAFGPGS